MNHRRGDSFGAQCRYKPSPNIPIIYDAGNTSQKVEMIIFTAACIGPQGGLRLFIDSELCPLRNALKLNATLEKKYYSGGK